MTELVGSDALEHASLRERVGVRLHLLMCRHCRAYVRSIRQIAAVARRATLEPPVQGARADALIAAVRRESERG
ncbi:MAG: anti-sigma factor [Proteobacteria bacterium]|nr:anti-sigma factor [Pseudomonadota bacterium]